ncbi:hypothetical protein SCRM01_175 [Synechococcus phage S-CRM01]|uniref:hypothetical protein n=1 Tax=Synechococcus phage S-CRM01 TaxID=1026955 RepID=UPI000209E400|nr:hypothetical protein SCRM01_175 [Synechococcus phage S-CRM01]AEC53121.1 hypothetical protein SCRM01_175 [Synechococcus phage S-CRM01]
MRRKLVEFVASLLHVEVTFPPKKEAWVEPKNRECRFAKEVMHSGEVFWYVEEYFKSRSECELNVPSVAHELYEKCQSRTNGKLDDRVWFWARHPKRCNSMEDAIEYLNNKIKKKVPLEVSYIKVE